MAMVACSSCHTENTIDSKFCKACGASISAEDRASAKEKLDALVAEGYRAFNDGRDEEAALIAQGVLDEDPGSAAALSLLGMCHENAGRLADALECFERVVSLRPDSALDRIKVTHLRNSLAVRLAEPKPRDRRTAAIGAIAAGVLVVASGIAIAGLTNRSSDSGRTALADTASPPKVQTFGDVSEGQPPGEKPATASAASPSGVGAQAASPPPADTSGARGGPGVPPLSGNATLRQFPGVNDGRPFVPPVGAIGIQPDGSQPASGGSAASSDGAGPGRAPDEGPDPDVRPIDGRPKQDPGLIDIRVSSRPQTVGGSVSLPDENEADALMRSAQQQVLLGRFDNASKMYERALAAGADPKRANQRLAQCYERLGKKREAIEAYGRAISAFEAAIASGQGDKASLSAGLGACRAALKLLQGGG
jgi:tetratricopeptide (TPR) repeat protein